MKANSYMAGWRRTFLARRTQRGHGFDLRLTNRKEGKEYSMCLGAEFKTFLKKILVKYYGTKERRKIKAMKKKFKYKKKKIENICRFLIKRCND